MADAADSKSAARQGHEGSTPSSGIRGSKRWIDEGDRMRRLERLFQFPIFVLVRQGDRKPLIIIEKDKAVLPLFDSYEQAADFCTKIAPGEQKEQTAATRISSLRGLEACMQNSQADTIRLPPLGTRTRRSVEADFATVRNAIQAEASRRSQAERN
jgi:hypothetical protein